MITAKRIEVEPEIELRMSAEEANRLKAILECISTPVVKGPIARTGDTIHLALVTALGNDSVSSGRPFDGSVSYSAGM